MATHNRNTPFRLYKRGNTWHAYISCVVGGHRVVLRETTGTTTRDQATQWAINRVSQILNSPENTHEITLDAASARWWHEHAQYLASGNDYLYKIGNLLKEIDGNTPLSQITKNTINTMVENLRAKGRTPATINRFLCLLSAICTRAHNNWECHTPDFKILSFRLKEPKENIKYFRDMSEINCLVANAPEHLRPIIWCALYTGLRRGRVLSLRWDQVDWDNHQIIYMGKDGNPHSVPMVKQLASVLRKLPHTCDFVFTYRGKPISDIKHAWHDTFVRSGLPYRSFHALRHTTATWLLQKTNNLKIVQNVLGHSNISVTTKYAHLVNNESASALKTVFD